MARGRIGWKGVVGLVWENHVPGGSLDGTYSFRHYAPLPLSLSLSLSLFPFLFSLTSIPLPLSFVLSIF